MKNKEGFFSSLLLLFSCIGLYYLTGIFGHDFPAVEVLKSIPISIAIWLLCAWSDPDTYRNFYAAIGSMIFSSCAFTAMFLIFGRG